jgi:UDP-glucose 4-epimerase
MQILLTGNRGYVGKEVESRLRDDGRGVVGVDIRDGRSILDFPALCEAAAGCDAVVHLAAHLGPETGSPGGTMETNLVGTWNVLRAASSAGVRKVVFMSSVDALGVFKGQAPPAYFPLDDDHPCTPRTPYGISKRLAEELCRHYSDATGIAVVCLRPPGVWSDSTYREIAEARRMRPEFEWSPFWEYGAFIDIRDLAAAVAACLDADVGGFHCHLVAADDITTSGPTSREWIERIHPTVEWRGGDEHRGDPFRSLVSCEGAKRSLGWRPTRTWRAFAEGAG